jgi:hypothetical protein
MRRIQFILPGLFVTALLLVLPFAKTARAQTGGHITLGMNPTIFRAGQPASAEISVSSVSITPLTLNPGSTFTFFVDGSLGTVTSVAAPIAVESSTLLAGDFSVSLAGAPGEIIVTYNGAPKTFAFGECLSVKIGLIASAQAGPGKLSLSSQFVSTVNGNLPFTTVSIVDFANSGTSAVTHDQSLMGDGTTAMPLGIAPGGVTAVDLATGSVTNPALAPGAVTGSKIAAGQVVKSINGLTDAVSLGAGSGITITPSGNTITLAANGLLSSVSHDVTLTGNGTVASPLGLAMRVRGMLFVAEDGTISTCYNGMTGEFHGGGTTTKGCGFETAAFLTAIGHPDGITVTLPFAAAFWFVTPFRDSSRSNIGAMTDLSLSPGAIDVYLFYGDEKTDRTNAPFMMIIY